MMKFLLPIVLFIFCSCEKDMETPRHQIVIVDDDYNVNRCGQEFGMCLPVTDLEDLSFQGITDFPALPGDGTRNWLIALPCDGCGDYDDSTIYDVVFGSEELPMIEQGTTGNAFVNHEVVDGVTRVQFVIPGGFTQTPLVGEYMFTAGDGNGRYAGWHEIIAVVTGGLNGLTTTTVPDGMGTILLDIPTATIIRSSFLYGKVVTGVNAIGGGKFLWNFNNFPALLPGDESEVPNAPTNLPGYQEGDCFRLCFYKIITDGADLSVRPTAESIECIGVSNCFRKTSQLCHTTRIKYQFNENSMGFYGGTPTLSVRLPMYLSRPQFPGEEKGYQKSDGTFLKLSERINKEWTLKTEWLPEALHERIRVALSADFIQIWNENENLALEGVYRDADYDIQWHEEVDYPVAMATTKLKKRILQSSVNSNCA